MIDTYDVLIKHSVVDGAHFFVSEPPGLCTAHVDESIARTDAVKQVTRLFKNKRVVYKNMGA